VNHVTQLRPRKRIDSVKRTDIKGKTMKNSYYAIIVLTIFAVVLYNNNSKLKALNDFFRSQKKIIEIEKQLDRIDNKLDVEIEKRKELERKRKVNSETIDSDINSLVSFFNNR
jgi:hypothetical protein